MLKHNLKTAIRNIRRNRLYAGVSILGLGVGLGVCLLALRYITYEFSFDRFKGSDSVYEVLLRTSPMKVKRSQIMVGQNAFSLHNAAPPHLIEMMKSYFSGIEYGTTIRPLEVDLPIRGHPPVPIKYWAATSDVFKVLGLHLFEGDPHTCLQAPNSIVLTRRLAVKCFGTADAVGRTMSVQAPYQDHVIHDCVVTGIIGDIQGRSSIHLDAIGSGEIFPSIRTWRSKPASWHEWMLSLYSFVMLRKGTSIDSINNRMAAFMKATGGLAVLHPVLIPMRSIHFKTDINSEFSTYNITYLYILAVVALLVLLVSCFNFLGINLALFSRRFKEIGVRKVTGARTGNLTSQFLTEYSLLTLVALALAFGIAELLLPLFNSMMGIRISPDVMASPITVVFIVAIAVLLIGLVTVYSLVIFKDAKPQALFKGGIRTSSPGVSTRRGLMAVQFAVGGFLVCCSLIVTDQLNFVRHKDLGFNPKHIMIISQEVGEMDGPTERVLENELRRDPDIKEVSTTFWVPGNNSAHYLLPFTLTGPKYVQPVTMFTTQVDTGFVSTLGLRLVGGRNNNMKLANMQRAVIVNQMALRELDQDVMPGDSLKFLATQFRIVAVVKDFNYQSLRAQVKPLVLSIGEDLPLILVKFRKGRKSDVLAYFRRIWKKVNPDRTFNYYFLRDRISREYQNSSRMFSAILAGSILAIVIALMGLFAIASFLVERKTKEIAVRKVLGSSVGGIIDLLSIDFIRLVLVANVVAWPVAYLVMKSWLQNFAYRISISLWVFPLVGLTLLALAFATVFFRVLKAARANPVDSLRYE